MRSGVVVPFGVFCLRPNSHYAYDPAERYPFHRHYHKRVLRFRGQWIIYYEPRSVPASRGYFAIARVDDVVPDRRDPDLWFALIVRGSYLDFAEPVPFRDADGPADRGLERAPGRISGVVRNAVRPIEADDFNRIVDRGLGVGFAEFTEPEPVALGLEQSPQSPYDFGERERAMFLGSRAIRDPVFRQAVLRAYDHRCAIFGSRLGDGRGRYEAQGAHIRPVGERGPDIVRNGMALSGTAHWLFDEGMIGLSDDYRILVSPHLLDAQWVRRRLPEDGRLFVPRRAVDRPDPAFLAWHRENRFRR